MVTHHKKYDVSDIGDLLYTLCTFQVLLKEVFRIIEEGTTKVIIKKST